MAHNATLIFGHYCPIIERALSDFGPYRLRLLAVSTAPHRLQLEAIVRGFGTTPGGLLPALHALQHAAGYIDRDLIDVDHGVVKVRLDQSDLVGLPLAHK